MDFFEKLQENPYQDLAWNVPERKHGSVNIIGGSKGSFRTEVKVGEFLAGNSYNIRVTIYGYEPAEVEVKLTPWLDGGHFDVGGDDDNVENGDYYPNGNHQDNEDDVVEDGE